MQERRLRLGETLDDYCPREKRLTNHVIVALVGDEVRTTRCSTCDTEHVYKQGKVPARRKKAEPQAALYKTVLDNITGRDGEAGVAPVPGPDAELAPIAPPPRVAPPVVVPAPVAIAPAPALSAAPPDPDPEDAPAPGEPRREEPVHRHTLIRATLPKIEGQVPERKPTDFTLWNVARGPQGRRGRPRPAAAGNGNVSWGGYSPYANGHPSGKGPQGQGGQPGKGRPNHRRGR
ncbi:hypothetical protein TBR22_A07980 [Luteitalea sp. TBR-22]|uniref:hypothetical protein n=1 Tax=Luteitalea sp. TBR-22 TaxID=2802971 RepID=UPI001AFBCB9D|nr:hypothetical protein [Luteitalea sp. TBR-22]BCS31596.1 hypothetical protein TBR22_A07980 [Luteitalea sp. TBR-22]